MKVSVLLLTLNEENNLRLCIPELSWCDDIVVLDSGSIDATREVAESFGARFYTRKFDDFAGQRNYALDNFEFSNKWVLHLDADEIVTPEFLKELELLKEAPGIYAYRLPSKIMFLNKWLKYSGMYPAYQVRLAHKNKMRFVLVGHGQRENLPPENVGIFREPYLHYCFSKGLKEWLQKHADYAEDEASKIISERKNTGKIIKSILKAENNTMRRRGFKELSSYTPLFLRPMMRFTYMYVFRLGFLDGKAGFYYSKLLALYEKMIVTLVKEQKTLKRLN